MPQITQQDYSNTPPPRYEPAFSGPDGNQTPLPLNEALRQLPNQYIRVLTKPSEEVFEEELYKSSWNISIVQLLIMIVAGIILPIIASLLSPTMVSTYVANSTSIGMSQQALRELLISPSISAIFLKIIVILVAFFIGVSAQFLLAKAFSGYGTFLTQSYATLLYQVPVSIISAALNLLGAIPVAGTMIVELIGLVLFFYSVVLNIYQIMATHHLSRGRATAVVLLSYAIVLFFLLFCVIVFGTFLLTTLRNIAAITF